MIIHAKAGETVKLETTVLDTNGSAMDLSDETVKFRYKYILDDPDDEVVVSADATVVSNVVSYTLTGTMTATEGRIAYEFWLDVAEDCIDSGIINLKGSLK